MSTAKPGAPLEFSQADNVVAETRRRMSISQTELGRLLGLTPGSICQFEKGTARISGPVARLCKILQRYPDILDKI